MDTNSNTVVQKKFIKIDVAHLDKTGYGPGGDFTRQAWRDECLKHFKAGSDDFLAWQNSWIEGEVNKNDVASFECRIHFDDGSYVTPYVEATHRSSLDFVGQSFYDCDAAGFTFLQNTIFAGTNFIGFTNFGEANFNKFVTFERVYFEEIAWFDRTVFAESVMFTKTVFNTDVWFTGAIFKKFAGFVHVRFNGHCNFSNFSGLKKNGLYLSQGVLFEGFANFENSIFETVGHFELAKFNTIIPNFLGVDISKTRLEFSSDEYFPKSHISEDAVKRLGLLKRLADEHGQTEQALMFNAFELNAKRAKARLKIKSIPKLKKLGNSDFWFANATYLYDKFSDYGRSFTLPLLAYLALMLVTWVIAIGHGLWASMDACEREGWNVYEQLYRDQVSCPVVSTVNEQKIPLTVPRAAFEYTAYRASGVLDFVDADKQTIAVANRLFNQPIEPMWMRIWGVLKAIASAALLFLAALGLRNKYRIK